MKKTYIMKKPVKRPEFEAADRAKREQVESIMGRKMQDWQWETYKKMTMDKPKN